MDSGARERSGEEAEAAVTERLALAPFDARALHYAKLDSVLRGHPAREIRAWLRWGTFERCIVAPAFPFQGRVTRAGRQYRRVAEDWAPITVDIKADLEVLGFPVRLCRPGDIAPCGLSLWDAEDDADLDAIVAAARVCDRAVLWCGSGGLAGAIASNASVRGASVDKTLAQPILGLFGSDQTVTAMQIEACGTVTLEAQHPNIALIARHLETDGVALVRLAIEEGVSRAEAADRIAMEFGRVVCGLSPPRALLVAGGETLRAVCSALNTDHLELVGQIEPGVPVSIMRGGRYDGVRVISKSGAFGDRELLKRLLSLATHPPNGVFIK